MSQPSAPSSAAPATGPGTSLFPPLSAKDIILMLVAAAIVIAFFVLPPIEPLTEVGMRGGGRLHRHGCCSSPWWDTTWPSILSLALFALTRVMSMNDIISASFGNWVVLFMLLNFVLADLLNNTGFINRLLAFFLSRKLVQKGPWHLTFVLVTAALILGLFMVATAMVVFFLGFAKKLFAEAGYERTERYPRLLSMALVFAISIAQTMTPFSHFLVIYGLDLYSQVTGENAGHGHLYALRRPGGAGAVPRHAGGAALLLQTRSGETAPSGHRLPDGEDPGPWSAGKKITVITFFTLILFWILPEILTLVAPHWTLGHRLQDLGVTFYLVLALAFLGVIRANGQPVLSYYYSFRRGVNLKIIFLGTACILMGNMVTNDQVGLNQLILQTIEPLVSGLSPLLLQLLLVAMCVVLTNFTSNLTALLLILGVGLSMAQGGYISPIAVTVALTYTSGSAFILPASSHLIGMLYGDEYADGRTTLKYGVVLAVASILISTFLGWPLVALLS